MGDASVGKTSLLHVYMKGSFPDKNLPTIGVEFSSKIITLKDNSKIKIQIFDTAGQEKYRSISNMIYRRSDIIILTYAINDKNSFEDIKNYWFKEISNKSDCQGKLFSILKFKFSYRISWK